MSNKKGVLLLNLGTPNAPSLVAVCSYLRTFLMDKRVIEIPYPVRWALVHMLILPFRSPKTTKLYQKIWQPAGSPLLVNTRELTEAVAKRLKGQYQVEFGMRYGNPSIESACKSLIQGECDEIHILPLFPQYSSAASGSALAEAYQYLSNLDNIPTLYGIHQFYQCEAYTNALSQHIMENVSSDKLEFLLFSYHGLPAKFKAYKQQCEETSHILAQRLNLSAAQYGTSFQSRLGRIEWLKPYTDEFLVELIERGVRNLTVTCPSFVSDCLETLEEINIGIRERWLALGGDSFNYIPCLNTHPLWVEAVVSLISA